MGYNGLKSVGTKCDRAYGSGRVVTGFKFQVSGRQGSYNLCKPTPSTLYLTPYALHLTNDALRLCGFQISNLKFQMNNFSAGAAQTDITPPRWEPSSTVSLWLFTRIPSMTLCMQKHWCYKMPGQRLPL